MFEKIGGFAVKYKYWLVAAWVVAAVLMFLFAPSLSEVGSVDESTFLPADSESLQARELIEEYFPQSVAGSTMSLIFFNADGLSDSDMTYAQQISDWLASGETPFVVESVTSVFTSPELASRLISPDNTTMLVNAGLEKTAYDAGAADVVEAARDHLDAAPAGLDVYVSGQVAIYADLNESLLKSIDLTTIVTIVLIIVLLLAIYRSPLSALVPLLTIGIAFLISRGVLGIIAEAGVSLWSQLDIFLVVLIFGVGTDYCLFLISRYREELAKYGTRSEAMKHTVGRIGEVIAASAFAVIVGLSGMAVARYQMIQTMGPMLGLTIFITLLAALTLTPALASVFGRALFWPRHAAVNKDATATTSGFWYRIANLATGHPVWVAVVLLVVLLLPYIALPGLNRSFDQMAEIPQDSESIQGFKVLETHYDIGEMDPLSALVIAGEGTDLTGPEALAALASLSDALAGVDGVVKVQSITRPEGTADTPAQLTVSGQLASIGSQITDNFNEDADPSALFSGEVEQAFSQVESYLDELAAFSWVADSQDYQTLRSNMVAIQAAIGEIRAGAIVENQLNMLAGQLTAVAQSPVNDQGLPTEQAAGLILLSRGYLDELTELYPAVADMADYPAADGLLNSLAFALTSSQPPASWPPEAQQAMADLGGSLQSIAADMSALAASVQGQGMYLMSQALAQAAQGDTPMNALETELASFQGSLQGLAATAVEQGNPVFLSQTLMTSSPAAAALMDAFYSRDREATRMYVILDSFPQSERAMETVKGIRDVMHRNLAGSDIAIEEAVIGGTSAEITDVQTVLTEDFNIVMIVVCAAVFIVLVLLLRSLVAPVYLLLTVLLSYGSTLGIVTWLFQDILGHDGISFMVPIIVFALLVALGSDYNIFLMSRIREEAAVHPPRMAARLAVMATGGVITACGIILAGTFAVLVITPIRTMVHIGTAVAIGIILDTFLVRPLLVPAIASLLGKWNWWPGKYGRQS